MDSSEYGFRKNIHFEKLLAEAKAIRVRVRIKNGRLQPRVTKRNLDFGSSERIFAAFQVCRDLLACEWDIIEYQKQKALHRLLCSTGEEPAVGRLGELTGLLSRLQALSWWLTEEDRRYIAIRWWAADDITYDRRLNKWKALQKRVRKHGYTACIFGPVRTCPDAAVFLCDACDG